VLAALGPPGASEFAAGRRGQDLFDAALAHQWGES
jgi:hypothetical protein